MVLRADAFPLSLYRCELRTRAFEAKGGIDENLTLNIGEVCWVDSALSCRWPGFSVGFARHLGVTPKRRLRHGPEISDVFQDVLSPPEESR
jgi:hypothetical protein